MIARWRTPCCRFGDSRSSHDSPWLPDPGRTRKVAGSTADGVRRLAIGALKSLIRFYQLVLSPLVGGQCRFYPTCSNYALQAIEHHGPLAGLWMALKRLLRCHPFHPGGLDLPPERGG